MDKETTVLVTGGAGFIGSHVTQQLLTQGAEVEIVDNLFAGEQANVPSAATLHEVDIRDQAELLTVVKEVAPDVIIHLAALHYIPYCNENPEEAFDVNVMGTRHLLEAARELESLDRLVYTSSAAVYPARREPHSEHEQTGPMDIYGRTKLVGEDLVDRFASESGVPSASARLFNVYGPNETNPHLIPAILEQIENGSRTINLGNLTPKRDFIWAGDVATALVTLATEFDASYKAYNIGTGTEWSVREVVEKVGEALGTEITIEQDQDRVRESDRPHLCADTTRLERDFEWQAATSFVDGLEELLDAEGIA